jgi:NOL1/NOP2/fmu family ribosome biogenesis protein
MSNLLSEKADRVELSRDQAISYLQRKELKEVQPGKGWKLVTYKNYPLGWINVLANRINNYYPKELRILKDF